VAPRSSTTRTPAHRWPDRRQRRAVDSLEHPQTETRHRHQRAGVARGDRSASLTFFHGLDGHPHRRHPAARRNAWLGLSSMLMVTSVWVTREAASTPGDGELRLDLRAIAE